MNSEGWRVTQCLLAEPPFGVAPEVVGFGDTDFLAGQNSMDDRLRIRMTDRRFYLLLTFLILTLACGEIVYAVLGPFSAPTHLIDEFSSRNRVR